MDKRMGLSSCWAARRACCAPGIPIHGIVGVLQRGTGWFLRQGDCAACYSSASVRMRANYIRSTPMSDSSKVAELPALRLKRNEDRRLHAGHLWIFSNEVDTQQTPLTKFEAGELVRVLAHNDRALGLAYVNPQVADQCAPARIVEVFPMRHGWRHGCGRRCACASGCIPSPTIAWSTASPMGCPDW